MTHEEKALAIAIGRRLMWVRLLIRKTQDEIVISTAAQAQYSRWETGKRILPPLIAIEICNRLRISMDYIYRGQLIGVHPELARKLYDLYAAELVRPPIYTGWNTDMDQP